MAPGGRDHMVPKALAQGPYRARRLVGRAGDRGTPREHKTVTGTMSSQGPLGDALAALAPATAHEQKLRDELVAARHHADVLKRSIELVAGELTLKNGEVEVAELLLSLKKLKAEAAALPNLRRELADVRKEVVKLKTELHKRHQ